MAGRQASAGGSAVSWQCTEENGEPSADLQDAKPRPEAPLDPDEEGRLFEGSRSLRKKNLFIRALDDSADAPPSPSSPPALPSAWGVKQGTPSRRGKPAGQEPASPGGTGRRRTEVGKDGFLSMPISSKNALGSTTPSSRVPVSPAATPSRTPGGGRTRRAAPGTPGQAARRRGLGKPTNPFIEYEDREVKLQQERKWLEQDSVFMRIRREGMRHQGVTVRNVTRTSSESSLYENRTMYGNYSVQLRRNKAMKDGFVGNTTGSPSRTPLVSAAQRTGKSKLGDHPHLKLLKTLQLTMEESTRSTQDCMNQASLGDDVQEAQDKPLSARPVSAGAARAKPVSSGRAASAGAHRR